MTSLIRTGRTGDCINNIIRTGTIALKWAFQKGLIQNDCFTGIIFCSINYQKREVLTLEQAAQIFTCKWKDEKAKLANKVAMCTGMRAGEILALRLCDIGTDRLFVRHSYNSFDGLKCCKNGESREVPVLPIIRDELLKLAYKNPFGEGLDGYVFFGTMAGQPIASKSWLKSLREVCKECKIPIFSKITFHGWRHLYAARMSDLIEQRKLQRATGHKTAAMLEHYADHATQEDFRDLATVATNLFLPVLEIVPTSKDLTA